MSLVIMKASSFLTSKTPDPVYHADNGGLRTRCKRRRLSYYPSGVVLVSRSRADLFARPCKDCFRNELELA